MGKLVTVDFGRNSGSSGDSVIRAVAMLAAEASVLIEKLEFSRPDDKQYLGGYDDYGWGPAYLSRLIQGYNKYGGGTPGELAMNCAAYICMQRINRISRAEMLWNRPGNDARERFAALDLSIPREDRIMPTARNNPCQPNIVFHALASTDRAMRALTAMQTEWREKLKRQDTMIALPFTSGFLEGPRPPE